MSNKSLISRRYSNDGVSLVSLNDLQRNTITAFINDRRIKYKTITECPLCTYQNVVIVAEKDRYGIPLETSVCERCGLIFSSKQMGQESTKIFYSEYYRPIYSGIEYPTQDKWARYYSTQLHGIPKFLKKGDTIVEVGTAGGWNLLKFKNAGFKHYGFDYDENLINHGKKQYGLNLICGSIEEAIEMDIKAEYAILSHVLEHTTHPVSFLSKFQNILAEKSILKVTVPSASMLFIGGGGTGYDLLGTLQNAHNFLFDEYTLKYAALKSGFRVYALNGEYIILRKNYKNNGRIESNFSSLHCRKRGAKVIRYLKICERFVPLKRRLLSPKIDRKLIFLYLLLKPIQLAKLYLVLKNPNLLQ